MLGEHSAFHQDLKNIRELTERRDIPQTSRRLAIWFTDDPLALLQIGKYPLGCGSCQHCEDGSHNQSLAAYIGDAHQKGVFVIDLDKLPPEIAERIESGSATDRERATWCQLLLEASIGRSVTKVVTVEDGSPNILLESTYTAVNKKDLSLDQFINAFIQLGVADRMGVKTMQGGGSVMVTVPASCNSLGQYEDGADGGAVNAGLGIKIGEYLMPARYIEESAQLTVADRRLSSDRKS